MRTYLRTGRIAWSPLTDSQKTMLANVANVGIGSTFSASLDSATEQFLLGNGVISATTPLRRTIPCFFTFDSPGLASGRAVYTPTIGDILHDAWIEVDTAWDGTTPKCDVGHFTAGYTRGWFALTGAGYPVDLATPDQEEVVFDHGLLTDNFGGRNPWTGLSPSVLSQAILLSYAHFNATGGSGVPPGFLDTIVMRTQSKFTTADPIKVCVSQNGQVTGADPGSTQGAAILYLDISTPQAA